MAKFSEVLAIVNGRNQKQVECEDGKYPIYGSGGIMGYANDYICEAKTVIIGRKGSINKPIFVETPFWNVDTAFGLCPNKEKLNPKYLYYFCERFDFEKLNTTVTIPSLTKANLLNVEIPLPSLEKQKHIVEVLDKISDLIVARKRQLAKLDELIKARFVEMFGNYPENENAYPVVNISDVADVSVGVVIKPSQYYVAKEFGIKAFRSLNIGEMYIKDNDWVYFSIEGNERNKKSQLRENDLLVVRSGAPGTSCVVTKKFEGCNAVDVIIARPNLNKVNPWYLCAYTNFPQGKKQIEEGTGGAAQQHFNVGRYNMLKVLLPPLMRQKQFASFVEEVDKQKQNVQQSLDKLELLKKALMQEYFG